MSDWINKVTIAAPANGTNTHTASPSSGTVLDGALFTPTANRLLVCVVEGAVTSTTPTGWTLPTNGSAINNTGLYVWYKTAAGNDSLTTTHNGSNYAVAFTFFEFANGSTFGTSVSATTVASGGAGPTLSGLSTTTSKWVAAVVGQGLSSAGTFVPTTWSAGTKIVDATSAKAANDGYVFSISEWNSDKTASRSAAATTATSGTNQERLVFSVNAIPGPTGPTVNAGSNQSGIKAFDTVTLNFSSTGATGTVTYNVTQTAGPTVTLSGTGATRTFTAPAMQSPGTLTFSVTGTDSANGNTGAAATVNISVLAHDLFRATASGWVGYRLSKLVAVIVNLDGGSASSTTSDIIDGGSASTASGTNYSGGGA